MKKFFKVLAIIVLVIFAVCSFVSCNVYKATVNNLRHNLKDSNAVIEKAEEDKSDAKTEAKNEKLRADKAEQQNATGESSSYIEIKFPSDGNYYVDSYQSKFYRDATCTQPIESPRFMSPAIDENVEAPNGFAVKAMRLDNGDIVYCPRDTSVYPVTEAEWEERLAEQAEKEAAAEE